jgi:hypothetical protein
VGDVNDVTSCPKQCHGQSQELAHSIRNRGSRQCFSAPRKRLPVLTPFSQQRNQQLTQRRGGREHHERSPARAIQVSSGRLSTRLAVFDSNFEHTKLKHTPQFQQRLRLSSGSAQVGLRVRESEDSCVCSPTRPSVRPPARLPARPPAGLRTASLSSLELPKVEVKVKLGCQPTVGLAERREEVGGVSA